MVYRGENIDSFSEKQTTDNLVLEADDFKKFLRMAHGSKYPYLKLKILLISL